MTRNKRENGGNGRDKQDYLVEKGMHNVLKESGMNEEQAKAVAKLIAVSNAQLCDRFDALSAQIAENEKASVARDEKLTDRIEKLTDRIIDIHVAMRRQIFWLLGGGGAIAAMISVLLKFL